MKKINIPVWLVVHKEGIIYDYFLDRKKAKEKLLELFKENAYQRIKILRGHITYSEPYWKD